MSKRVKHVFANADEVAHVWAQQCQDTGRTSTGNIYFCGATIYSYGSHFPIATFRRMPNGKKVVLYDNRSYSSSTSRHQGAARWALSDLVEVVHMHSRFWNSYIDGKQSLINKIIYEFDVNSRAREYAMSHTNIAFDYIKQLKRWGELHRRKAIYKFTNQDRDIIEHVGLQKKNTAKRAATQTLKMGLLRQDKITELNKICGGDINKYWHLNGKLPSGYLIWTHLKETLCRVQGDEVITSIGARVPIRHAMRLLPMVKKCKDEFMSYSSYTDKGQKHSFRIGYYTLNTITTDGDVTIGCHRIPWSEVEYIGKQLMPELFGKEGE